MPKVSVIIPNYNHARFLEQRIESILNQTFQDFEIIFLDDKSQDNSQEVFSQYANHPKISHAIFNETNSGSPFKQWDRGFALATGDYIWIAESDDYASPTILEKLVQKLDAYASVGLAYSQSWKVDENGTVISKMNYLTDILDTVKWEHDYIASGIDECSNCLGLRNIIPNASAVLFRRCFITELDSYIKSFKLCGDWLFWIKILLKCDVAFIAEPLNYFRFHPKTARSLIKNQLQTLERITIVDYLLQSIKIPDHIFYQIQDDILGCYLTYYNLHPINYRAFIEFVEIYQRVIAFSYKLSHYLSIHIILFKKAILILRFKLAIRTKIKQFLDLPQIS